MEHIYRDLSSSKDVEKLSQEKDINRLKMAASVGGTRFLYF